MLHQYGHRLLSPVCRLHSKYTCSMTSSTSYESTSLCKEKEWIGAAGLELTHSASCRAHCIDAQHIL